MDIFLFIFWIPFSSNSRFFAQSETLTKPIKTGTSTKGPITAANAWPEFIPKTPIVTAIANSKLLLAAVKESVAVSEYMNPKNQDKRNDIPNIIKK